VVHAGGRRPHHEPAAVEVDDHGEPGLHRVSVAAAARAAGAGREVQPHEGGGGEGHVPGLDARGGVEARRDEAAAPVDQEERGEVVDDLVVVAVASHGNRGARHSCARVTTRRRGSARCGFLVSS
jgi:hypothetical protein